MNTRTILPVRNEHLQRFLQPLQGTVIRHWPVKSGQFQQTGDHAHGLAERQIEEIFDHQAELNRCIAELFGAPPFADWAANHAMS